MGFLSAGADKVRTVDQWSPTKGVNHESRDGAVQALTDGRGAFR